MILKHKFDSIGLLKEVNTPVSIIMVNDDKVIPNNNTLRFKDKIKKLNSFKIIQNSDHNKIMEDKELFDFIEQSYKALIK